LNQEEINCIKKALIFMLQPPGSSGVQAYRMKKILPFMEKYEWTLNWEKVKEG
jgi:hypothetical protein